MTNPYISAAAVLLLLYSSLVSGLPHTRGGASQQHDTTTTTTTNDNMNGDYDLSTTPHAGDTKRLFPTRYKDYPNDVVPTESFDVYSPIVSQLYSQVFWKGLPPVKLPEHIVSKYDGKVMAVIGFELDQVRVDKEGKETSLPFNALYNHHFESTMIGGHNARFELVSPNDPRLEEKREAHVGMGHGIPPHQPYWLVVDGQGDDTDNNMMSTGGLPTQQAFGGANGGEVRQSFHGYAPGFAQLIESPKEIQITPMQIDTWNRDEMDLGNSTHFVAGPLPRNSRAPPNATYSGLLECPVTTRITKHLPPQGYFPLANGVCSSENVIASSDDCFKAVTELVRETDSHSQIQQSSGSDATRPKGCSVRVLAGASNKEEQESGDGEEQVIEAYYNQLDTSTTTVDCGSSTSHLYSATATSLVQVYVLIDTKQDLVTIQLTGPADVWFGVGFGARMMNNRPWTIIVEGDTITERKLADHDAGAPITPPSITVKSNTVEEDKDLRTVVVTRSLKGPHFSFHPKDTDIKFINAIGSSEQFSYHQNKEASSMLVFPVGTPNAASSGICMCRDDPPPFGSAEGSLEYHPVKDQPGEKGMPGKVPLVNKCEAYPRMDLLEQKNPTCDARTYTGGQLACHHMWSLLDADQDIPWVDQPLEYRLKFRFWVQPYNASYHTNVYRTTWGIGSPVEYDVPKCGEGVPGCTLEDIDPTSPSTTGLGQHQMKRWVHTIHGTFSAGNSGKLISAHFHCHAPTCLRTELYLCEENTNVKCDETTATLLCQEDAVWGKGEAEQRFNEPGFIYQPPCLWGSQEFGLEPPVDVRGRTLFAKKTADATYAHLGEMAWLQMYYVK